jgi:RimJ/RimL family protein N-acetyltransferase
MSSASFIFESARLALKPFEPEDLPALYALVNQPELAGRRYLLEGHPDVFPLSKRQVEDIYEKWRQQEKGAHLAAVQLSDQALVGYAECDWDWDPHCPFLSVVIDPERQRLGYGSEVVQLLLRYLFLNTPAHNVSGWMAEWNQAARTFALKNGFLETGRSRREGLRDGAYFDAVLVDILRPEWMEKEGSRHAA